MGADIQSANFRPTDFSRFGSRLAEETRILAGYFKDRQFASDHPVGGFELEAWLVDEQMRPAPVNSVVLHRLADPMVVPELAASNVEFNGSPMSLRGNALSLMLKELSETWRRTRLVAQAVGSELVTTGILPSVRESEVTLGAITDRPRYRALNEQVLRLRGGRPMDVRIAGRDVLLKRQPDVMLEAATTSFQVHLQVPPDEAGRFYNAAVLSTAPLVAATANSPYLFGRDLWRETRIPLFEQAVDLGTEPFKRVGLGTGYAAGGLMDFFRENLACHPVLLPIDLGRDSEHLPHLLLHNGTVWRWVRPLVGFDGRGPTLRIEQRVIPAGPTLIDCIANAALSWGLTIWLARLQEAPESVISFDQARRNLYRAARLGLNAHILWIDGRFRRIGRLLKESLPAIRDTLVSCGLDWREADFFLEIIDQRLATGRTGAEWQRAWADRYRDRDAGLTRAYLERQIDGQAVHTWDI